MNVTVLDVETTTSNKGNPFDTKNSLCVVSISTFDCGNTYNIEYDDTPYGLQLKEIQDILNKTDILVGFNIKFDLNWLRKYGINLPASCWVFDCQLFEYLNSQQQIRFDSLGECATRRGVGNKSTVILEDYWDKGINTTEIPYEVVVERVESDVDLTYQIFLQQYKEYEQWPTNRKNLFRLLSDDLRVLHEIEFNGMAFDKALSLHDADLLLVELNNISDGIRSLIDGPKDVVINLDSGYHISAILYGGDVVCDTQVEAGRYKTGPKAGQIKYKLEEKVYTFPRLVQPKKGTLYKGKENVWSSDQQILNTLQSTGKAKKIIKLILERSEIEKKYSTYLFGLPKLMNKMNWPENMIYGTINQTATITGRTSSSKPNLQNFDKSVKYLFRTRYVSGEGG